MTSKLYTWALQLDKKPTVIAVEIRSVVKLKLYIVALERDSGDVDTYTHIGTFKCRKGIIKRVGRDSQFSESDTKLFHVNYKPSKEGLLTITISNIKTVPIVVDVNLKLTVTKLI